MRTLRSKKIKNETSKYVYGPFDDSLIQIQLDKNEKCIHEIGKGNFERAGEFLRQIKTDGEMISSFNRQKNIIKSLSLNTQSYFYQKQNKYEEALKCLQQAEKLQESQDNNPIDLARTKLNKSVILSHLGEHERAINLGKTALQLLKTSKSQENFELHKNQYKLYEIMIISFYNIASELSHLSQITEAHKIYKEGYYLAQKTLGPNHKLTHLLRSIVKQHKRQLKQLSKSKQKLQTNLSEVKSNKSLLKQHSNQNQLIPINRKQKELKRIYANKKKNSGLLSKQKSSKRDINYYLKSLQKIQNLYAKNKKGSERIKHNNTEGDAKQKRLSISKIRKLFTESSNQNRYNEKKEHQRIKQIILNSRPINKNNPYSNGLIQSQNISRVDNLSKTQPSSTSLQKIQPLAPKINNKEGQNDQIIKNFAQKIQIQKQDNSNCQLI